MSCPAQPNSAYHRFCVGQLSTRNFRALLKELTKKLTELGGADKIMPMIELYQQFNCTHDNFHETEIHRQDVIYKSHYGSFLQAFQCQIKLKGITGNVSKKVKHHERFLMLTYNAHLHVCIKQYSTTTEIRTPCVP